MWLPIAVALSMAPADEPAPAADSSQLPLEELVPAKPAEPAVDPAPRVATDAAAPSSRIGAFGVGLELGLDVPGAARFPMASTRVEGGLRFPLPGSAIASVGLRSGYSYVAGETAVADPTLGVDDHALLMAHRLPMRVVGRLGLRAEDSPLLRTPIEAGIIASGGADVVVAQAQSFGRAAATTFLVPGGSAGGYVTWSFGELVGVGLVGEWEAAFVDLAATTPGVSGDLSVARLALLLSLNFG